MRDRDKTKSGEWTRDRLKMKKTQEGKAEERERERESYASQDHRVRTQRVGVCVFILRTPWWRVGQVGVRGGGEEGAG